MRHISMHRFLLTALFCAIMTTGVVQYAPAQAAMTAAQAEQLLRKFDPSMPDIMTPRNNAIGGYHTGYLYNQAECLLSNPATLSYIQKPRWTFASVGMNFSGPFFDILSVMTEGDNDITDSVVDIISDSNVRNMQLSIPGPIAISFAGKNLAFGLYNCTSMEIAVASITQTSFLGAEGLMMTCGYGDTVMQSGKHSVSLGLSLKGFMQFAVFQQGTLTKTANYLKDFDIDNAPVLCISGLGCSIGALYNYNNVLFAGITWRDPLSFISASVYDTFDTMFNSGTSVSSESYRQKSDLSIGICWEPEFKVFERYITRLDFMLDYHHLLDLFPGYELLTRNPILNLSFGSELVIHDVLSLRFGINECYLCSGVGLDLTWVLLDFAIYGKELGLEPGQQPCFNLAFSLSFAY